LAVLRLMTNSIFVDWAAGRSPGLGGLMSCGWPHWGPIDLSVSVEREYSLLRTRREAYSATRCPRSKGDLQATWHTILTIFNLYTFSRNQGREHVSRLARWRARSPSETGQNIASA